MLLALGAVSSALDALKSLTSSDSSSSRSTGFKTTSPFNAAGSASTSAAATPTAAPAGYQQISLATMSALLDAQSQSSTGTTSSDSASPSDALKDLFSQIDANGDGQLSKSEFENALGAGGTNLAQADDVFSKLDKDGSGTVSFDEMSSALKGSGGAGHAHHHHHHVASTGDSSGSSRADADPLMQALSGASSTSVTNSDGSITTSLTYADGSRVTMTSPAATTTSSSATSSYNLIEQMIQRESQAISFSAANPSVSFSA